MDNCPKKSGTLRSLPIFGPKDGTHSRRIVSALLQGTSAFPARRGAIRKKYYQKGGILQMGKRSKVENKNSVNLWTKIALIAVAVIFVASVALTTIVSSGIMLRSQDGFSSENYEIIFGHRRIFAAKKAGLAPIANLSNFPCGKCARFSVGMYSRQTKKKPQRQCHLDKLARV